MVALAHQDGAEFHARICPGGYNQVVLVTQVRLRNHYEPEQPQRVTNTARAREIAQQLAKEQGFDTVIWAD